MYEQFFKAIESGKDPRHELIELRKQIKKDIASGAKRLLEDDQVKILEGLLEHEDPKTRKNAVLILGEAACTGSAQAVYEAYNREKTLFVRSSYLTALRNFDYRPFVSGLKQQLDLLASMDIRSEDKKHYDEERRILSEMLFVVEKPKKHTFTGWDMSDDVLLVVSPGMEQALVSMLPERTRKEAKPVRGGVRVQTQHLKDIMPVRLWKQLLFRFPKATAAAGDWQKAADALMDSGLIPFLKERHEGDFPFRFRVDLRSQMPADDKGRFIRRFAGAVESSSGGTVVHSPSYYEFEIRVTEDKKQQYHFYIHLTTIPDDRFVYRKHALPTSMHPVRAAEVVALARPWLAEDADVLDPFCGTGTLLIERAKAVRARKLYGVDLFGDAIRYARESAGIAQLNADLIQRDIRDFKSNFLFSEILTELPAVSEHQQAETIDLLYSRFIGRIPELLAPGSPVIICCVQPQRFEKLAERSGFLRKKEEFPLSGRRGECILVFTFDYLL